MAIRTVLQLGDPGLREVAKRVENPAAPEILCAGGGLGGYAGVLAEHDWIRARIAAPQIGANLRVIFLRLLGEEPGRFVNPVITERSKEK